MNEKDFVMAWLLAAKAGTGTEWWSDKLIASLIENAQDAYNAVKKEYSNETNS